MQSALETPRSDEQRKLINAWALYDWANSSYALIITSAIFPLYYVLVTSQGNSDRVNLWGMNFVNTTLYSYALAFAYLVIAALSPLLSGIADYGGNKKQFMQFFCYLGSSSCALMYFFTQQSLGLGIILVILACIGFSGSTVFYNAYLPEIAEPKLQDYVSAKGFGMGYLGSVILMGIDLSMFLMPQWYGGISVAMASRLSFVSVGVWWLAFAQVTFYYLPKTRPKHLLNLPWTAYIWNGYKELIKVWHKLKATKGLRSFLCAFFVYNMGVQTVLLVATLFATKEVHMESSQLIINIMLIQFLALAGAYLFSYISKIKGNIFSLKLAVSIWAVGCMGGYYIYTPNQFYVASIVVGLVMGGIQALSRSTYSKMLPLTMDHAAFFSFYDVCEKIGVVLGMALFGFLESYTSSMRKPILSLIGFFILGFFLLTLIPRDHKLRGSR